MKNESKSSDPQKNYDEDESSQEKQQPAERTKNLLIMEGIQRNSKPIITEPNFKQKVFTTRKDDFSGKTTSSSKGSRFCWSKCYCCPVGIWNWK